MPEMIRSFTARLREFIGNSRRAPRRSAHVPVRVTAIEIEAMSRVTGGQRSPVASGFTRDISLTGLAFVVPAIHVGGRYLTGEDRKLHIQLALPECEIELDALPVRYERLSTETPENGYVIGAHITDIREADRGRFIAYLKTLR